MPDIVHAQIHIVDDPGLTGGASYVIPKLVFTSDVKQVFGRLSQTQMAAGRERSIYDVVKMIYTKPEFRAKLKEDAVPAEDLAVNQTPQTTAQSKTFMLFSSKA